MKVKNSLSEGFNLGQVQSERRVHWKELFLPSILMNQLMVTV